MSGYHDHKVCEHCGRNDLDPLEACTCPGANKPRATADHSQRIQDIKSRAEKLTDGLDGLSLSAAHASSRDVPWLLSQLDASLARELALREALAKAMGPRPAKQCPNCGDWTHFGDCNHTSSTRHSTLYGVCKKCADRHAAFGAALQGETK